MLEALIRHPTKTLATLDVYCDDSACVDALDRADMFDLTNVRVSIELISDAAFHRLVEKLPNILERCLSVTIHHEVTIRTGLAAIVQRLAPDASVYLYTGAFSDLMDACLTRPDVIVSSFLTTEPAFPVLSQLAEMHEQDRALYLRQTTHFYVPTTLPTAGADVLEWLRNDINPMTICDIHFHLPDYQVDKRWMCRVFFYAEQYFVPERFVRDEVDDDEGGGTDQVRQALDAVEECLVVGRRELKSVAIVANQWRADGDHAILGRVVGMLIVFE